MPFTLPGFTWTDAALVEAIGPTVSLEPALIRIVPINAYKSYAITPHPQFGAVSLGAGLWKRFQPGRSGACRQHWCAVWRVASGRYPHASRRHVQPGNRGHRDHLLGYRLAGDRDQCCAGWRRDVYLGDYHGGKDDWTQTGINPAIAAMVALFNMVENYTANWPNDAAGPRVGSVTSTLVIDATSTLTNTNRFVGNFDTLTAALALLMVGSGFTRASIDLGENWTDISATGSYPPVATKAVPGTNEVWFRNPTTGTIVKAQDNAQAATNFEEKYWDRNSDRVKLRSRFDTPSGGDFGDQTCVATYSLAESDPDPCQRQPFTDTFDASIRARQDHRWAIHASVRRRPILSSRAVHGPSPGSKARFNGGFVMTRCRPAPIVLRSITVMLAHTALAA
ncbi:MAG: hypothetical protein U5M50_00920 [Sphingobium sp.]|nr:hypothetical protein [Sphingobium sp.]